MVLVVIAAIIASPISYYFIQRWLENFAFTINLDLWVFVVASVVVIFLAFTAIIYQTLKAAFSNPVDSLRYE